MNPRKQISPQEITLNRAVNMAREILRKKQLDEIVNRLVENNCDKECLQVKEMLNRLEPRKEPLKQVEPDLVSIALGREEAPVFRGPSEPEPEPTNERKEWVPPADYKGSRIT